MGSLTYTPRTVLAAGFSHLGAAPAGTVPKLRKNAARDNALLRDFNAGERPATLERKYNISIRRAQQIILQPASTVGVAAMVLCQVVSSPAKQRKQPN